MIDRTRPFGLNASGFFVIALVISVAVFFILWGILHDAELDSPWIASGITSSILLLAALIVREVYVRTVRARILAARRRAERMHIGTGTVRDGREKLTLEQNAAILGEIRRRSDAANVLGRLAAGHREVFELCGEYLERNEEELKRVAAGSPRLAPLLKGRTKAVELHRYHMLKWAEIEVTELTREARSLPGTEKKILAADAALDVLDRSLAAYPAEKGLIDSRALVGEILVSLKVADSVEQAELAEIDGDGARARRHYRDALFELGHSKADPASCSAAAERINAEIERLRAADDTART